MNPGIHAFNEELGRPTAVDLDEQKKREEATAASRKADEDTLRQDRWTEFVNAMKSVHLFRWEEPQESSEDFSRKQQCKVLQSCTVPMTYEKEKVNFALTRVLGHISVAPAFVEYVAPMAADGGKANTFTMEAAYLMALHAAQGGMRSVRLSGSDEERFMLKKALQAQNALLPKDQQIEIVVPKGEPKTKFVPLMENERTKREFKDFLLKNENHPPLAFTTPASAPVAPEVQHPDPSNDTASAATAETPWMPRKSQTEYVQDIQDFVQKLYQEKGDHYTEVGQLLGEKNAPVHEQKVYIPDIKPNNLTVHFYLNKDEETKIIRVIDDADPKSALNYRSPNHAANFDEQHPMHPNSPHHKDWGDWDEPKATSPAKPEMANTAAGSQSDVDKKLHGEPVRQPESKEAKTSASRSMSYGFSMPSDDLSFDFSRSASRLASSQPHTVLSDSKYAPRAASVVGAQPNAPSAP